jgi:cytosol aminopeptidase
MYGWQYRCVVRSPSYRRLVSTMAKSSAYVLPYEPNTTSSPVVSHVDPAKLFATTPGSKLKVGTTRIFYDTPPNKVTAVVSLGDKFASQSANERRESVRKAIGSAVKQIKDLDGVDHLDVDAAADAQAAGQFLRPKDSRMQS